MTELLWLLLVVLVVIPFARRAWLRLSRQRLRTAFEKQRGSRVIVLVHREETLSLFGLSLMRYIDIEDSEQIIRAIQQTDPQTPIDLILHTPGGLVLASLQIARAIARHPGPVTAFVPHYAMSGGTLIALAADRIVMCQHAVLGPIDPQVDDYPAASILRAVERKEPQNIEDDTLILADQAAMALAQLRRALADILRARFAVEEAERIAEVLTEGRWTHDYPIVPEEAGSLGLTVDTAMPELVMRMMAQYPATPGRARSVEYGDRVAGPRRPATARLRRR